jgi:hypothetical protein
LSGSHVAARLQRPTRGLSPFGEWNGPFLAPYLAGLPTDFQTEVRARVTLDQAAEAIEQYKREMTGGKVLIMPGLPRRRPGEPGGV